MNEIEIVMINQSAVLSPLCTVPPINSYETVLTSVIVPIVFTIIIFLGTCGNIMVLVVIICNIKMRNSTNILIASLAIADLTFIVFCVPFTGITYATHGWPLGKSFCRIYQFLTNVTAYCSVYSLVLMCFDRFLAVVHPISSSTIRSDRNTVFVVVLMWVFFAGINFPLFLNSDVIKGRKEERINCVVYYCTYLPLVKWNKTNDEYMSNRQYGQKYFTCFFVFAYFLPLFLITLLYGKFLCRLLCGRTSKMAQSTEALKSKKRVTMMIIVVIIVFGVCWFPIQCIFILQMYGNNAGGPVFRTLHVASNCLAYANSMVNPILYAFLSENFRRSFIDILCLCNQHHHSRIDYERTHVSHNRGVPSCSFRNKAKRQSRIDMDEERRVSLIKAGDRSQNDILTSCTGLNKFDKEKRVKITVFLEANFEL